MSPTRLICLALVAAFCGMASAQAISRYRTVVPLAGPSIMPCGCNNPCDDLCTLIQLANTLNNGQSSCGCSGSSCLNVDDIISKLVNALIATTVGQGGSGGTGGSGGGSKGSNPVIGLNLLGPNGLLAGLGLGGTEVLEVVAGGSSPESGLNGVLKNLVGGQ